MHKRFVIKLVKFVLVLVAIDLLLGGFTEWMFFRQKTGKYARLQYIMDRADADIVIFGSSHALCHYDPAVFRKMTGLTCYNAGVAGRGVLFTSVLEQILTNRIRPKVVLLNIDVDWLYESKLHYDGLGDLYPYLSRHPAEIRRTVLLKGGCERFKVVSRLYRFNSTWAHIIRYAVSPQPDLQGFLPIHGKTSKYVNQFGTDENRPAAHKLDSNFVQAFELLIRNTASKGIPVITVISPMEYPDARSSNASYQTMTAILRHEGVPLFDHYDDTAFSTHEALFKGGSHLNFIGAERFSAVVSRELKGLMIIAPNGDVTFSPRQTNKEEMKCLPRPSAFSVSATSACPLRSNSAGTSRSSASTSTNGASRSCARAPTPPARSLPRISPAPASSFRRTPQSSARPAS